MSLAPGDTDPAALALMTELYARMTPAQKLERVRDLTLTSARLALAALRARHPGEHEGELLLRLARLRLGDELVERVYSHSALRKLEWYRRDDEVSDRQWRDVLAILRLQGDTLDRARMQEWASRLGVTDLLARAFDEARGQSR